VRSLFNPVHSSRGSVRISISTSDRNRQNRSRKRRHPSLGGSGHDLPLAEKCKARRHDRSPQPVRRIGKRSNQFKFTKQPNGALFPVAITPANAWTSVILEGEDYRSEVSINAPVQWRGRHQLMAVNAAGDKEGGPPHISSVSRGIRTVKVARRINSENRFWKKRALRGARIPEGAWMSIFSSLIRLKSSAGKMEGETYISVPPSRRV
jgi:hypothetical protein